jgi:hypothetical protein
MVDRLRPLLVIAAVMTAVTACAQGVRPSSDDGTGAPNGIQSASPASSPVATEPAEASPTAYPTGVSTQFTADGIGPYQVGSSLTVLQAQGLIADVQPSLHCDDSWQSAEATGPYAGQVSLTFHQDRLTDLATDSPELVTPSGARVGMTMTELQGIYGDRGTLFTGVNGNQAFSVRVLDTLIGIVFFLDETNTEVVSMSAGGVQRLEGIAASGEGC